MDRNLDREIITQLKEGNDLLFKKFYLSEKGQFTAWCEKELYLNAEEAQDFYQEAQMYLYENIMLGKLDELTSKLTTYLYSIAKNQIRTRNKKQVTVLKHEESLCEHLVFLIKPEELSHDKEELVSKIKQEMDRMLEPCKSLLKLFYYESLSFKGIAQQLGYKNDGVAKNQKKRCLERLRENTKNEKNGRD